MALSGRWTACVVIGLTLSVSGASASVQLIQDGLSQHQIVLQDGASPSQIFAAQELQAHIQLCAGIELPIVQGLPSGDPPMIVLGCGDLAAALGVNPTTEQLGEQGFLLRTVPPHIVIAGTPQAGTLYGVYRFLESQFGVRWFAPGVTKTPGVVNLTVPNLDRLVKPAFLMRDTSYAWPGADSVFRARVGDNRNSQGDDHPQGTGYAFYGTAHTSDGYIHPDVYFDQHPEYFSEIGGVRIRDETQLCLTNPDVFAIVKTKMRQRMLDYPTYRQFNFSQEDYYNYCQCENCRAINEQYGTPGGTQFWFVNKLAEELSAEFPDMLISTLAYMYTAEPPKNITMHQNVAVWLCHMYPSCDSHPIETCPLDADYKRRAVEWSNICSHLYMWHYIVDFAHYYNPFPNLRAMAADMRFYRDLGVEGVYLQAMSQTGGGGEFSLLRPYYGMKLLWDPDQDPDAIIQDFLDGYYGPAAQPIWQYVQMLHDKVEQEDIHMHLYTNPAQGYLTDDVMQQAQTLFDQAETAVQDDPNLLERVRVCRMPITYARMFPRNGYQIADGGLHWQGDIASETQVYEFHQRMIAHGFRYIREWDGYRDQVLSLATLFNMTVPVETIENDYLAVDVVPILAGRALRIIHKPTGQCVTSYNNKKVLYFPFVGGMEHRIGETYRFTGWMESGAVLDQSDASITVGLQPSGGWQQVRTFSLEPNAPTLNVQTSAYNVYGSTQELRLRSHLELNLGQLRKTRVRFTNRAGANVDKDMTHVLAGLREGEHFYRLDTPLNAWTFSGGKDLTLTQTFDPNVIDFTWLYAYPESLEQLDAEVWAKRQMVAPGQAMTFNETLTIELLGPDFDAVPDQHAVVGQPYQYAIPLLQGAQLAKWVMLVGPRQVQLDPNTGVLTWNDPDPVGSKHTISVRVTNPSGTDEVTFQLDVVPPPAPPVIHPIDTDTAEGETPYVSEQPWLLQGNPAPTWSLVGAPAGMKINASTGVVTWTSPDYKLSPYTITLRATNDLGQDDEKWQLTVLPPKRPVTLDVSPPGAGLTLDVDGTSYWAPQTFNWRIGTKHKLDIDSPQVNTNGTTYTFLAWNDGEPNASRAITVADEANQHTAIMNAVAIAGLKITGPETIRENAAAQYHANLMLSDGTSLDVTDSAKWWLSSTQWASVAKGRVAAREVETETHLEVHATYTKKEYSLAGHTPITITDSAKTFGLSVSTSPAGAGGPVRSTHAGGDLVTISVPQPPEPGMLFVGWSGDASGTANPLVITMNDDKHIIAQFAKPDTEQPATQTPPCATPVAAVALLLMMALALLRRLGAIHET
ncbi:MAG: DUF4838 domain-containing protein [Phycisphaerae bacterium]|nr:DUF4838 domain-containing protein [Phycisphaerae bacterium]